MLGSFPVPLLLSRPVLSKMLATSHLCTFFLSSVLRLVSLAHRVPRAEASPPALQTRVPLVKRLRPTLCFVF